MGTNNSKLFVFLLLLGLVPSWAFTQTYGAKVTFVHPIRELGVIITRDGYYPQKLAVFTGEQLRIFLATTTPESGCLVMPAKELVLSVVPGQVTEGLVSFDSAGTYPFFCPAGKLQGEIVVLAREKKETSSNAKDSSVRPVQWRPKEE